MAKKFEQHRLPQFQRDSRHRTYDLKRYAHPELGPVARFRSSGAWQLARDCQLARHPVCANPLKLHGVEPASQVHHVVSLVDSFRMGQLRELGTNPNNLRSLCPECHARVERMAKQDRIGSLRLFLTHGQLVCLLLECDVDPQTYEHTKAQEVPSQAESYGPAQDGQAD